MIVDYCLHVRALVVIVAAALIAASCGADDSAPGAEITVFAAASLTAAFTELGDAFSDIDPDVALAKGEELGVPHYTDYKKCVKEAGAEAVTIATPHFFHPTVGIYAMKNGLHVLSEKPIAATISAAERMAKTAKGLGNSDRRRISQRWRPSRVSVRPLRSRCHARTSQRWPAAVTSALKWSRR